MSTELQVSTTDLVLSTDKLNNMMAVANIMATGISTVPKHLQKNAGDCLAVVMQALQWGMNPFAVAQKTHLVNGVLGYEAQLVNAVAQSTGAIQGRFHYEYQGDGEAVACRVGAVLAGETDLTWGEWLNARQVTTKNSPLWKTNPKQQMGYLQVKNWSRTYCPAAILGVYTPDELETITEKDVTPPNAPIGKQAAAGNATDDRRPMLLESARNVAMDGDVVALRAHFVSLSKEDRAIIGTDEMTSLAEQAKAMAEKAKVEAEQAPIEAEFEEIPL